MSGVASGTPTNEDGDVQQLLSLLSQKGMLDKLQSLVKQT